MLTIQNYSKCYQPGKKTVVSLSLTVEAGDVFGFIGHNGAGKTTLIRSIVGILDFEEGEILVDGHSVKTEPLLCKQITAYLPDNPDLYEHLTGIQYLSFIADLYRLPREARQKDIEQYADAFEMTKHLGDLVASYSHGMKQKLAVISALIHHPKLFVLDEPFVGLDPKASHTLKELLKETCRQGGAVFFSTHVLEVAEKICNKIAVIQKGKLIACGDTQQVKGDQSLEEVFLELIDHDGNHPAV